MPSLFEVAAGKLTGPTTGGTVTQATNKSTGVTKSFNAEVIAVAKKDLNIGDILDGEGGFAARGKLISSRDSVNNNFLPLGLSDGATIKKEIKKDDFIKISDVNINWNSEVLKARNYQVNLIEKKF